jgi:hypothetical protein
MVRADFSAELDRLGVLGIRKAFDQRRYVAIDEQLVAIEWLRVEEDRINSDSPLLIWLLASYLMAAGVCCVVIYL